MGREWLELVPDPEPTPPTRSPDPLLSADWARAGLRNECEAVASTHPGARNDRLNEAAFSIGQLVGGGSIEENEAVDALIAACRVNGLWDEDPRQCRATIASGLGAGYAKPRWPPERSEAPQGAQEVGGSPEPLTIDWSAVYADTRAQEWLCEPIVPMGGLVSLYAAPKVGKSLLALELAVSISMGGRMLGAKCRKTPVLYLDYENTIYDVRDRLIDMGYGPPDLGDLHYWSFPRCAPLDTMPGGLEVLRAVERYGVGLVVLDTVSRTISGDENDAKTWLALYRHTLQPLKAAGVAVLRLDHSGKDEDRGQRGSSAKSGDVDMVWQMREVAKGSSYVLNCEAHRMQLSEAYLNIERATGPLTHRIDMRSTSETRDSAVLNALSHLPSDAGRDRARAALKAAGVRCNDRDLSRILKARQQPEQGLTE